MKLIIDVDEELVCKGFERNFTDEEKNILIRAIGNAIPLNKAFEYDKINYLLSNSEKLKLCTNK